ncbi:GntR family transcriptional regulator [Virgibacillus flavescens]|uniref:GntR family transcriptional regulator n=1 Tax=Virgibacillus flavescens TaxID=1611422 RepID=UPI003D347377
MILNTDSTKPIYIQISEWMETEILNGTFQQGEKVHSQYTLAEMYTINPATAAKGLNILSDEGILFNKRGLGKFVSDDAIDIIRNKRKDKNLKSLVHEVVLESERLQISEDELINMIKKVRKGLKGEEK